MGQDIAEKNFGEIATHYAQDVVDGKVLSCKWVRLACERHLRDLSRAHAADAEDSNDAWPYRFNIELIDGNGKPYFPAERVCRFAELMPHVDGDWAARRELIKLEPWEIFILASIFGWVHKITFKRRFRVADLFVPRKNAKSTIGAVIGLYMFAMDGEHGAQVFSGATSEYQAYKVFTPARQMTLKTTQFLSRYGITVNKSNLSILETNSKFEPVIGNPGDGDSPSCAIVDEYHEHKTPALFNTMKTGMGARSQPLLLTITTSGSDIAGPCYQHQVELQKVLEGVIEDDRRFGIIYTIDEKDDWTREDALIKANPNFGVSVDADFLRSQQRDAIDNPRNQSTFKTKHLNIWMGAASPWVNLHKFQLAGDTSLKPEQFAGETCWYGLDLASKIDIASRVKLFRREIDGKTHYYAFSNNYVPQAAVEKPENAHYSGYIAEGFMTSTAGNMIHLRKIEEEVVADSEQFVISEVAMDAWGAREMAPSLQEQGFTVVDIPMNTKHLSEPMKEIEALVEDGRFHHDGNKAFVWMVSNVDVDRNRPNEMYFPRKMRDENKIDAAVALIICMSRAMLAKPAAPGIENWLRSAAAV